MAAAKVAETAREVFDAAARAPLVRIALPPTHARAARAGRRRAAPIPSARGRTAAGSTVQTKHPPALAVGPAAQADAGCATRAGGAASGLAGWCRDPAAARQAGPRLHACRSGISGFPTPAARSRTRMRNAAA